MSPIAVLSEIRYIEALQFQMHAQIKLRPLIEDGAYHVFTSLKLNNDIQLSPKERTAVLKKVANNSYFAHPEAIIIASLG